MADGQGGGGTGVGGDASGTGVMILVRDQSIELAGIARHRPEVEA
jgi:hypothetical protein